MNKPLEAENMAKLRALAQSLGTPYTWQDDKAALLKKIRTKAERETKPPEKPIEINVKHPNVRRALSKAQVAEALEAFLPLGLRVTFPDAVTWELYCNKKRDTGSMYIPLWNVVQCAKEVVKP